MRIIETANAKKRKKKPKGETMHDKKFKAYWSLIEPRDFVEDLSKKAQWKTLNS